MFGRGPFKNNRELVPAHPGHGVDFPHADLESFRYGFEQFVTQIVGAQGAYRTSDIEERLRTMLLSKLQDVLGETGAKNSVPEMIGLTEEIGAAVRAKTKEDFEAIGFTRTFGATRRYPLEDGISGTLDTYAEMAKRSPQLLP